MSNVSYITTRKHIKSYNITAFLQKINKKRFNNKLTVSGDDGSWKIRYLDDWDGLDFYTDSARKLHVKHPHGMWWDYVGVVFRNELGKMTYAVLSDEGVEETWKPNPQKYPSYKAWLCILHSFWKDKNPEVYKETIQIELSYAPKGMETY